MAAQPPAPSTADRDRAHFPTTHWSVVLAAGRDGQPDAGGALAELCAAYWFPLYTFIRRRGHDRAQAEDLTQGFFHELLESGRLARADPAQGRFRGYLVAMLRSFLAHEWEKSRAQKRGSGEAPLSLDFTRANERYQHELVDGALTPEQAFDRAWTLELLQRVLRAIEREYVADGKAETFARLRGFIWGDSGGATHETVAGELGVTPGALKVTIHRLRQKVRARLREEIAATLVDPAETDAELRHLLAALGGPSRNGL